MTYSVPLAVIFGLVLLLSFGAATAAAETGGQVGVCVVGIDSPCNDPGDTPASDPFGNDTRSSTTLTNSPTPRGSQTVTSPSKVT